MASLKPGGSAYTPTSGGQDLTFSRILAFTCKVMKLSSVGDLSANSIPKNYPTEASRPPISRFRLNESHLVAAL
ncbi:MAG: hypothetical protein CLLPBCKN_006979 [Chroococcidiopsis cubana SAG 39.79]|nr:hypothetical protein [Chroococcidiopsis cubana SAG 39.79]